MAELEIGVMSIEEARRAVEGGADTLEVMADLAAGGLTAPLGMLRGALEAVGVPVNAIVRPRPGDFVYSEAEVEIILRDAQTFAQCGVASVVFGAVKVDGALDTALIKQVARVTAPVPVTLHRALDVCANPDAALRALVGVVPRVLTAGPAPTAWDGRETTRRWVAEYAGDFRFALSGGIRLEEVAELAAYTGARTLHVGGAARTGDGVDVEKVRRLKAAVEKLRFFW